MRLALLLISGCAFGAEAGLLQQPVVSPKGASGAVHMGFGGGGGKKTDTLLGLGLDSRVDVASGGSRWNAGTSLLAGVRIGPAYLTGRIGVWRAIVSGTDEAAAVPTFEIGGYVPTAERFDEKHPQFGSSATGVTFGIRDDIDTLNYVTVFVGYAAFISPGI